MQSPDSTNFSFQTNVLDMAAAAGNGSVVFTFLPFFLLDWFKNLCYGVIKDISPLRHEWQWKFFQFESQIDV